MDVWKLLPMIKEIALHHPMSPFWTRVNTSHSKWQETQVCTRRNFGHGVAENEDYCNDVLRDRNAIERREQRAI